jgi:protein-S-isoprenylcysteine O-methyltransferase Ste14
MSQGLIPLVATAAFAFVVYRWASDDLGRERRLSGGAANALLALIVLVTSLVLLSALGGVGRFYEWGTVAVALGTLLAVAGAALAAAAVWALGSRERLLGMRFDAVVSWGPYRFARHPFYLGWTAALLGAATAGATGPGLAIAVLVGVFLFGLARNEERFLLEELGADYESYRRGTAGLFGRRQDARGVPDGE